MPKNFIKESIQHHILRSLERVRQSSVPHQKKSWHEVAQTFELTRNENGVLTATWSRPKAGRITIDQTGFLLYQRGDMPKADQVSNPTASNSVAADKLVAQIGVELGLETHQAEHDRFQREELFHDGWAAGVHPEDVLVRQAFEACTAPEHRFIRSVLGDLRGKRLLDLGSGLGEASVYFATQGATVTACDLSRGMLEMVSRVASYHHVAVSLQHAPAEKTSLPNDSFDVVYAGNLLHHVDIAPVLDEIKRILVPGGLFVTWDPLAHNPIINVYRRMAGAMRTIDEHPLHMHELELFRSRFQKIQWRCFWLTTLVVFLRFYFWERVHPSKERYWKKILTDAERLEPFYRRLEKIDDFLFRVFPWLDRYCWNIVVWGKK